jgi:hypothetical protein
MTMTVISNTVTQLYVAFEQALADIQVLNDGIGREPASERLWAELDGVVVLACALCRRIIATPANPADPIPDMLLKIAAAGRWQVDEVPEALAILVALRSDLQAMRHTR